MSTPFARYVGRCWRAVAAGQEAAILNGAPRAGRYNRCGEPALYMSGSPAGVTAAMERYGAADRTLVALTVSADRLIDLRAATARNVLGLDPAEAKIDWIATLDRGKVPPSWRIADRARALGATGMIDPSRRASGEWHLILFKWNIAGGAIVRIA